MWLDNASKVDMLFYKPYSDLITEIIENEDYSPLTIGIFGLWGAGKSTLLNMIKESVDEENATCIEINAWNFEGYEDAKISVMESIINTLEDDKKFLEKAKDNFEMLRKRINWLKVVKKLAQYGTSLAISGISGNPMPLLLNVAKDVLSDKEKMAKTINNTLTGLEEFNNNYIKEKQNSTVENIRQFRNEFSEMLNKTEIKNLVVLIDDLDRCTPDRIIETLEAIKLFLSVEKTTFVIAADENVIQYAIKNKYPKKQENDPDISKEYIEKIIQLPIYIPELSSKDIENYLMILVAQKFMKPDKFELLLNNIYDEKVLISDKKIDLEMMNELTHKIKDGFVDENEYKEYVEIISKIKGIVSTVLKGNPRQAKRFLNIFVVKKKLAECYYGEEINIQILAKLLVLQKVKNQLFITLNEWNKKYTTNNDEFEKLLIAYKDGKLKDEYPEWDLPQIEKWLECEPKELQKEELDKYFYLTRELLKENIVDYSTLSSECKEILEKIGSSSQHNIASIIDLMTGYSEEIIRECFSILLPEIKSGKTPMYVVKNLFEKFTDYREAIIEQIESGEYIFVPPDFAYWKPMYKMNTTRICSCLDVLKEKNKIDDKSINIIKGGK